jgi:hypothetical protein
MPSMSSQTVKRVQHTVSWMAELHSSRQRLFREDHETIDGAYEFISSPSSSMQNRVSRTHLEKLVSVVSPALPHSISIRSNYAFISPFSPRPSSAESQPSTLAADGQGHGRKLDINGTRISRLPRTKAITPVPVSRHWRLST